jgi:hypothetical protein
LKMQKDRRKITWLEATMSAAASPEARNSSAPSSTESQMRIDTYDRFAAEQTWWPSHEPPIIGWPLSPLPLFILISSHHTASRVKEKKWRRGSQPGAPTALDLPESLIAGPSSGKSLRPKTKIYASRMRRSLSTEASPGETSNVSAALRFAQKTGRIRTQSFLQHASRRATGIQKTCHLN